MYSIMGRRPDEKPYSELPFPRPMPECPGNGLVMFDRFSPAETLDDIVVFFAVKIGFPSYPLKGPVGDLPRAIVTEWLSSVPPSPINK